MDGAGDQAVTFEGRSGRHARHGYAARYLDLHERRDRAEEVIGDLDTVRRLMNAS